MPNVKKYILTAVTLGAIAMCAGALIGATDLITRDRIAENEVKKINEGFAKVFGEGATGGTGLCFLSHSLLLLGIPHLSTNVYQQSL